MQGAGQPILRGSSHLEHAFPTFQKDGIFPPSSLRRGTCVNHPSGTRSRARTFWSPSASPPDLFHRPSGMCQAGKRRKPDRCLGGCRI